jgi:hypothetical protein
MKKIQFAIVLAAVLISSVAKAAGLDAGTTAVDDFKVWFLGLLGILAVIYLAAKGGQLASDKIQWADFGQSVFKVAVVGSAVTLGTWAYAVWA